MSAPDEAGGPGKAVKWGPVLVWLSVIYLVSDQPDVGGLGLDIPGLDKLAHVVEYGVLGLLLGRALERKDEALSWGKMALFALGAVLFAVSDEAHQSYVPGREADLADLGADAIGLGLGLALTRWRRRRARRRADHAQ